MKCPHCEEEIPGTPCPECGENCICGCQLLFGMRHTPLKESAKAVHQGKNFFDHDDEEDIDFDNRVLCPDGTCTGIIVNGRCSECGKVVGDENPLMGDEEKTEIKEASGEAEEIEPAKEKDA